MGVIFVFPVQGAQESLARSLYLIVAQQATTLHPHPPFYFWSLFFLRTSHCLTLLCFTLSHLTVTKISAPAWQGSLVHTIQGLAPNRHTANACCMNSASWCTIPTMCAAELHIPHPTAHQVSLVCLLGCGFRHC